MRKLSLLYLIPVFYMSSVMAERIPQEFNRDAVQFVFSQAGTNFVPSGTCFIVTVPIQLKQPLWKRLLGKSRSSMFPYMVTSKHVLFDENGNVRPNLFWRVSNAGGGVSYSPIDLDPTNHMRILTHPDPAIDIAAFTIDTNFSRGEINQINNYINRKAFSPPTSKLGAINADLLKDKKYFKKNAVHEGDDIFFVGLFTSFYGSNENLPIFRFGRLSMVTDEHIPFLNSSNSITPQDLYLAETQVFGGNSGSPVFFYRSKWRQVIRDIKPFDLGGGVYLAGIVKGHFNDWSEVKFVNSVATPVSFNNVGVAAIVPAYYLHEILFSEGEKRFRKEFSELLTFR